VVQSSNFNITQEFVKRVYYNISIDKKDTEFTIQKDLSDLEVRRLDHIKLKPEFEDRLKGLFFIKHKVKDPSNHGPFLDSIKSIKELLIISKALIDREYDIESYLRKTHDNHKQYKMLDYQKYLDIY
jgi:hypothetical protein